MGDYAHALGYNQSALRCMLSVNGENHLDTAYMYNNLGATYLGMEEYPQALDHFMKAYAISQRVLVPGHPFIQFLAGRIGLVKSKMQ